MQSHIRGYDSPRVIASKWCFVYSIRELVMYVYFQHISLMAFAHGRPRPSLTAFATWLVFGRFSTADY